MTDRVQEITISSPGYPSILGQISDPPLKLYCRGNIHLLNNMCFGVVGTRKLTAYGKEAAQLMVAGLVRSGFTIVSGLALGIDAVAHEATLQNNGKTIAVLGTGIDEDVYPRENIELGKKILKQDGLIISEYKSGSTPHVGSFPQRNRIISGLSKGVLIVEADEKSGSLITARLAGEQGRDVFAVPGNIFSSKSSGPHSLIKKGAKLVTSVDDILEEYNQTPSLFNNLKENISTKDPFEKSILDILDKGFVFIDDIVKGTGKDVSQVLAKLSMLEINGTIKNIGSGKYTLK